MRSKLMTKTDVKTKVTKNIFRLTKDKKNVMIRAWVELKPENLAEGTLEWNSGRG